MDPIARTLLPRRLLWLAALVLIGSTLFAPIFDGRRYLVALVWAVAGALAVEELSAWRRWPGSVRFALHLVAGVLVGQAALFFGRSLYGAPTVASMRAMGSALTGGWTNLLTAPLPAPSNGLFLVVPFVLTWASMVVASALARRVTAWVHLVGVAVVAVGALAFGPTDSPVATGSSLTLAAAALAYLAWSITTARVRAADGPSRWTLFAARWTPVLVSLLVVAGLVGAGARSALAGSGADRATLRSLVTPTFDASTLPSPLAQFKSRTASGVATQVALDVRAAAGQAAPTRIRLAALDEFDGRIWSVGASGSPLAGTYQDLRAGEDDADAALAGRATITVRSLDGDWLPTVGADPAIVAGGSLLTRAKINRTAGSVVVPAGLRRGDRYDVRYSTAPRPTAAQLRAAGLDLTAGVGDTSQTTSAIQALAATVASPSDNAYDRVVAVTSWFRDKGFVDPDAVPGHSLGRLTTFVGGDRPPVGTGEQFAAAAALVLRSVGVPVRVGVGFRPTVKAGTTPSSLSVKNGDISAWVEVRFAGYGWVPFDVTPPASRRPSAREVERLARANTPSAAASTESKLAESASRVLPKAKPKPTTAHHSSPWRSVVLGVLGVVLAALGYVGLMAAAKRRRRTRRRRHADPYLRVMGAFDEVLDRHAELGWRPSDTASLRQIGREFGPDPGAVAMRRLVAVSEEATFHPGEPSEDMAEESWRAASIVLAQLTQEASVVERLRALADPRTLVGSGSRG